MPSGIKGIPPATCHPNKPHYGIGLCRTCYGLKRRKDPQLKDRIREQRTASQKRTRSKQANYAIINRLKQQGVNLDGFDYNKMLAEQGGVCAICKQPETIRIYRLATDHCHKTKKIRSLLCNRCNTTLGKVNESIELLQEMINYIRRFQ